MAPNSLLWNNFLILFGGTVISEGFLNLKSPHVRVALDRNGQEAKEEKSISNPVESSMAVRLKPPSSGMRDKAVDFCVFRNLREQCPVGVDV